MEQKKSTKKVNLLANRDTNFSDWYTDVILNAKLADYSPVKGCMVIRPHGYAIWEKVQAEFNKMMKTGNVENAYFPLFIPESFLKREKEHVKGFSPELAVVTIGGGEKLKEKLVVRPTSETIMYEMYAQWLKSWRDLPILINQWNNVVRWEKRTYLFLRTTEFLWQEGHTVHETHEGSLAMTLSALTWYKNLYQEFYGIDGIVGVKSETERFAGADRTYTYEMLMPDGKALQGCTSHDLGQNFAKGFNMKFQGRSGKEEIPWQTSWGLSTRSIGALIMVHGDNKGLVLPPKLAPIQVVIVPIFKQSEDSKKLRDVCSALKKKLNKFEVKIDDAEDESVGRKFHEWELQGVPIRVEMGKNELSKKTAVLVRRDTGEKIEVKQTEIVKKVREILIDIQKNMFKRSSEFLKANTREINSYDEFKKTMETTRGFLKAFWCEDAKCEAKIKEETKASTRCLPLNSKEEKGKCVYCSSPAVHRWIFAQSY